MALMPVSFLRLTNLRALHNPEMVVTGGTIINHPKIKKRKQVEAEMDKFL